MRSRVRAAVSRWPAPFPVNGRSVFKGHRFVSDELLSDSKMRHHPLTPMTGSNLERVLQPQTRRRVGLVAREIGAARGGRDPTAL